MLRGVEFISLGAIAVAALIALAGCGHNFYGGEREAWRREAEVACITSGAVKESPSRVRISPISGPGICGATPTRYRRSARAGRSATPTSRCFRRPGCRPPARAPQRWPVVQSPPTPVDAAPGPAADYGRRSRCRRGAPRRPRQLKLGPMRSGTQAAAPGQRHPAGRPMSLYAPGVAGPARRRPPPSSRSRRAPTAARHRPRRIAARLPPMGNAHIAPPPYTPPNLAARSRRTCPARPAARPERDGVAPAGRSQPAGDARLPDRLRARSMDQRLRCSPRRCAGFASRSSRSNKSPPIPAAA